MQYPQILDECITHLQDGSWTLDSCLAQYPMYADQLSDDLAIFQLAQHIDAPALSASALDAMEAKLLQKFDAPQPEVQQPKQPAQVVRPKWHTQPVVRWVASFVFIFMFLVVGGGGTVAVSSNSLPGDDLYNVKTTWEQVVVFGAEITNQEDAVWLNLAETRASEIITLQETGRSDEITNGVLDIFYFAAENAILYSTSETITEYVELTDTVRPIFEETILNDDSDARAFRILQVLSPQVNEDGILIISSREEVLPEPEETPTEEPTAQPTATFTLTATPTITLSPTLTQTATPTETRTPTPSRTPTALPTIIITTTSLPTMTATPTLTPLPLGQAVDVTRTVESDTGEQVSGEGLPDPFFAEQGQFFIRETERAVELTKTALAPAAGE